MAAPSSKRSRLDGVVALKASLPYISQSALAALFKFAADNKLPDITARHQLRRARFQYVHQDTPYGTIHQRLALSDTVSTEVQHPMAMLYHCTKHSANFSHLMRRTVMEHPVSMVSPWNIIFYSDEVSPGNQLAYAHRRKTWAVYWSFLEFGPALSSEDASQHADANFRLACTHSHAHTHTHTHTCARTRTHAHAHAHTHTQTHTHTHTCTSHLHTIARMHAHTVLKHVHCMTPSKVCSFSRRTRGSKHRWSEVHW